MQVQRGVIAEAYRGLVSDGVLNGKSLETARTEAAEQLAPVAGRSVAELLADATLRSVTWSFTPDEKGRQEASAHLKAAGEFFGVSVDELRHGLSQLITDASTRPVEYNVLKAAILDPGLVIGDKIRLFAAALRAEMEGAQKPESAALAAVQTEPLTTPKGHVHRRAEVAPSDEAAPRGDATHVGTPLPTGQETARRRGSPGRDPAGLIGTLLFGSPGEQAEVMGHRSKIRSDPLIDLVRGDTAATFSVHTTSAEQRRMDELLHPKNPKAELTFSDPGFSLRRPRT